MRSSQTPPGIEYHQLDNKFVAQDHRRNHQRDCRRSPTPVDHLCFTFRQRILAFHAALGMSRFHSIRFRCSQDLMISTSNYLSMKILEGELFHSCQLPSSVSHGRSVSRSDNATYWFARSSSCSVLRSIFRSIHPVSLTARTLQLRELRQSAPSSLE